MKRSTWKSIVGLATGFFATLPVRASAVAPRPVSDEALARKPIIVVARWPRASIDRHDLVVNKAVLQEAAHTELVVERVIQGEIRPGRYELLFGWGVDWPGDEGLPGKPTSSERLGEVEDITRSSLWFLSWAHSWDRANPTVYLSLDSYCGVQPLQLEPLFDALRSSDREQRVMELIHSESALVHMRAAEYFIERGPVRSAGSSFRLCGLASFFSMYTQMFTEAVCERIVKRQGISGVRRLLISREPDSRAMAARFLVERGDIRSAQPLLIDGDAGVRDVVARLLMQQRDEPSAARIGSDIAKMPRPRFDSVLVEELAGWGNRGLVPALIACLQSDGFEGWDGGEPQVPALKARAALQKITGYTFPFDVRSSQRAWDRAQRYRDAAARVKSLAADLGNDPEPLQATAVEDLGQARVEIKNRSAQPITLARRPDMVEIAWVRGNGIRHPEADPAVPAFALLRSGESIRFHLPVYREFLAADPATRQITLLYTHNGNESGVNAWIGLLKVTLGIRSDAAGQTTASRVGTEPPGSAPGAEQAR